jgi:hypothetical protein
MVLEFSQKSVCQLDIRDPLPLHLILETVDRVQKYPPTKMQNDTTNPAMGMNHRAGPVMKIVVGPSAPLSSPISARDCR